MKNYIKLSIVTVLPLTCFIIGADQHEISNKSIKLESRELAAVDGIFINADTLEIMRSFQRMLMEILLGKKNDDGNRSGNYECNGKKMCVLQLAQYESQLEEQKNQLTPHAYNAQKKELAQALTLAKADFLNRAREFQKAVGGSKDNMILLVEESCEMRNRKDSLLMIWAKTPQINEVALFDDKITSAVHLKTFLMDLFHFLGDLVHSCPKAHAQLQLRMNKFNKIKGLMPELLQASNHSNKKLLQQEFLKHIKQAHLDTLTLDEITVPRLHKILKEVRC